MYKLVLFDFDGTTLDSDMMLLKTFEELYSLYKKDETITYEKTLTFSGPPIKETLMKEFPEYDIDFILNEYLTRSEKNYERYVKLFPGVEEILIELRRRNVNFALITSKNRSATNLAFSILGIDGYFPLSICSDEVVSVKPSPEGICRAMRHFKVNNPQEVIYIGDGLIDYMTARNAGVDFGLVDYSPRKNNIPLDDVDLLIKDWNELLEVVEHETN